MAKRAMTSVESTLAEREQTHGSFDRYAEVVQELKDATKRPGLHVVQREALDMICSKVARIVVGNADEADHWHDIAGYAMLVEKWLHDK